jgi:hypothetical protein
MPRIYECGPAKTLLSVELTDEFREYTISHGPWSFRDNLCFVVAGEEFDTKVPLKNVREFREKPLQVAS